MEVDTANMSKERNPIIHLLNMREEEILVSWKQKINRSHNHHRKNKVFKHLHLLFQLYKNILEHPNVDHSLKIKALSKKVANGRFEDGEELKEFLEDISIIRLNLFALISQCDESIDNKSMAKEKVNYLLDLFLYNTITIFIELTNELKDKENEKISETHRERLTMLGQITSSFVHEFRNPLTSIKGFIQLLKAENSDLKYLDIIANELEQLNSRISQFLLLSRKEQIDINPVIFSLNQLIEEVITFLYPSIVDTNVKVDTFLEEDIFILGYLDEIRQVLLNIILNALDVIAHVKNPTIVVSTSKKDRNFIELTISNNGPQIKDDLLKDIFKPFTTTKKNGTGLGLFVCKEIIEKHRGALSCISTAKITAFTISLPITVPATLLTE